MTNVALKEIHIANKKSRDANVRFVSLIKEADPRFAYKGKNIKNSRLLINSEENSENNLVKKYKSKLRLLKVLVVDQSHPHLLIVLLILYIAEVLLLFKI